MILATWFWFYVLPILTSLLFPKLAVSQTSTTDPFTQYIISAPGINVTLIPYGARVTHVLVPDNQGNERDIAVGYDDPHQYLIDTETNHTYFGAIVGRYANRIRNGTFTLPETGSQAYHIPENENGGIDTLHGGFIGYDQRNWTVTAQSSTSLTFSLFDPDGFQGFPGNILTHATFTVSANRLTCRTVSMALDKPSPIMLANHIYWNLNAFTSPTILNDTLHMPYSARYVAVDGILIPTGAISSVSDHPILDFTTPKPVGRDLSSPAANGICGTGCTGYDNAFILDEPVHTTTTALSPDNNSPLPLPQLTFSSDQTGIRMDVRTNQRSLQIYSCNGQNGTIPIKPSQMESNVNTNTNANVNFVNKHGCLVVETQQWIDGINHPEWDQLKYQVYSSESGPAVNFATYDFSTFK